jgi:8-oxo-dGTP pyrophosphatase MutT (NUDIX family)
MAEGLTHFPMTGPLAPADASAVILVDPAGRYLMQERDDIPGIFYPGHLGLFGGAREGAEDYAACAAREVEEELGLDLSDRLVPFITVRLDFAGFGYGEVGRAFFTAAITSDEAAITRVAEGKRAVLIDGVTMLRERHVTPYDAFALWQHLNASA